MIEAYYDNPYVSKGTMMVIFKVADKQDIEETGK